MLDRASTFADPEIIALLKSRYVPVAIDQAYQRRQKDTEGEFYRKIASQGPRNNFNSTTQGFYIASNTGKLLHFNNNRDTAKLRRQLQQQLKTFQASAGSQQKVAPIKSAKIDSRYNVQPPAGGLIVRVGAKILDGYEPTKDRWRAIFQNAISRDNLWISKSEHEALTRGKIMPSLQTRIARFHLVDNTRGEPPMWDESEIRKLDVRLKDGKLEGTVKLATKKGDRGYEAKLFGHVEVKNNKVVRIDMVALGSFWGEGTFTRGAPKGRFPLAVSFTLADGSDTADHIPPQGSRGWIQGYIPRSAN